MGGAAWYLLNTSPPEEQAGAWDFVAFLNQPEAQVELLTGGSYLPWRPDVLDRPEVQEYFASSMSGRWLEVAARQIDLFETQPARQWQVTDQRPGRQRRDVLGLFNWDETPGVVTVELARLNLPNAERYAVFDYWGNQALAPVSGTLSVDLPRHGCRLLAIRPLLDRPFLLSTSRHVSQGILEVTDEAWDASAKRLTARSQVVAGDAYELRIAAPRSATLVTISPEDAAAGVSIVAAPVNHGLVRVQIRSPISRTVRWCVGF